MDKQPATVVRCPECRLISPPGAMRCDCGYDFVARTMRVKPPLLNFPDPNATPRTRSGLHALRMNYGFRVFVLPLISAGLCAVVSGSLGGVGGIFIVATLVERYHYYRDLRAEHQKGHPRTPRCPLCQQWGDGQIGAA